MFVNGPRLKSFNKINQDNKISDQQKSEKLESLVDDLNCLISFYPTSFNLFQLHQTSLAAATSSGCTTKTMLINNNVSIH